MKFKVAERGEGLTSDSFLLKSGLLLICFVLALGKERFLKVTFATKVRRLYKWYWQNPTTFFTVTSDSLISYPVKHLYSYHFLRIVFKHNFSTTHLLFQK